MKLLHLLESMNEITGFEHDEGNDHASRKQLKMAMRSASFRNKLDPWIDHGAYTIKATRPILADRSPTNFVVFDEEERPVGSGTLMNANGFVRVAHIWLEPDYRKQGIADAVYSGILDAGHVIKSDSQQSQYAQALWTRLAQRYRLFHGQAKPEAEASPEDVRKAYLYPNRNLFLSEAIHPSQLVNVDTPQFRSWFGNSKAVDDQGHPIVFYRGTTRSPAKNIRFRTRRGLPSFTAAADIASIYAAAYDDPDQKFSFGTGFGEEPPTPQYYRGAQVTPVFLSIQNPVDMRGMEVFNFEHDLFTLLKSDWSNWNIMQMALEVLRELGRLEGRGAAFHYELPDPPGGIERGDWENVIEWLDENWEEADAEQWNGPASTQFTSTLADIQVDAYAIVDTPTFTEWASLMGFDGVVHDDIGTQGAKYAQVLLGKDRPTGLDADDVHVTWRPFEATQVKSIFNRGGWGTTPGTPMTDSVGQSIHDMSPEEQQEVMAHVYHTVRSVAFKYRSNSGHAADLAQEFENGTETAIGMRYTPGGFSDPDRVIQSWEGNGAPLPNTPELEAWALEYAAGRERS